MYTDGCWLLVFSLLILLFLALLIWQPSCDRATPKIDKMNETFKVVPGRTVQKFEELQ